MSDNNRAARQSAYENAVASGRMEGLEPQSGEANDVFKRYVEGELDLDALGAAIDEVNAKEFGPIRLPRDEPSQKSA